MAAHAPRNPVIWFLAGGVLMVVMALVGALLLFTRGPVATAPRDVTAAVLPAATPTPARAPAHRREPRFRCWDGRVIKEQQSCNVTTRRAELYAFALAGVRCTPHDGIGDGPGLWSYLCKVRGVDVHVATFTPSARAARLRDYGAQQDLGAGRVFAGGPKSKAHRWIRTYNDTEAGRGLLMYASVAATDPYNRQVLLSLGQRLAPYLLQGDAVTPKG